MPLPDAALRLLDRQFGVVGRAQLCANLTEGEVEGHVRRGSLVPVTRGVYRSAGGVLTPAGEAMAYVLRCRPDARITGPRVLALLGVDGLAQNAPFEVLVRPGRRVRPLGIPVRTDPTPGRSGAVYDGVLPIVKPADALVDTARFASTLGQRTVRLAYDVARWRGLVNAEQVRARCLDLGPSDPGAAWFLSLDDAADWLRPESEGERALGQVLHQFEPAPESQVWVLPHIRVDWFWRVLRLAIEYHGRTDHAAAKDRSEDSSRTHDLGQVGVKVVPVVAADLDDVRALRSWLASIAAARARELGVPRPQLVAA